MIVFQTTSLVKRFGALLATDHVSLDVYAGEIHALIGPNGAGKSTLINIISGVISPDSGQVSLNGIDITSLPTHARVHAGLSRCFQITSIFQRETVLRNLQLALQRHTKHGLSIIANRRVDAELEERAVALAVRLGLESQLYTIAGTLPHGVQRQLDVALALASEPKVLLLDEPMAGMGAEESERMTDLINSLKRNVAILLIEHDMKAVFNLADRISVLVYGKMLMTGDQQAVRNNSEVQAVYLGKEVVTQGGDNRE